MAPVKQSARKDANNATKARSVRTLSASHKKALADGRTLSATVDRYLAAVNTPKRRGRKVPRATMQKRLVDAQATLKTATGVEKLLAAQAVRDLGTTLVHLDVSSGADVNRLEADFIKIAKTFGENRGIGYGAWRDAGVPAVVLKRAGVARTRG